MTSNTSSSDRSITTAKSTHSSSSSPQEEEEPFLLVLFKNILLSATTYIVVKVLRDYFYKRQSRLTRSSSSEPTSQRLSKLIVSKKLYLDAYEEIIAQDIIDPDDIDVQFRDVGGMDEMKNELYDLVVLPLLRPDLFISASGLVSFPRGILLYGSPGTGKTMLAKAIAKEGHATFLNVRLSSIFDKYFGESNKLIAAIFSLSKKLAPSVIFIDEIDSFLSQRGGDSSSSDCSAISSIRSEFLTLWDGMNTSDSNDKQHPVMVLGATNRPYDVDAAILRRLPRTFEVDLPNTASRLHILELILKNQEMTKQAQELLPSVANMTEGYSGSDLKELCRCAAMEPIREYTSSLRKSSKGNTNTTTTSIEDYQFGEDQESSVRKVNEHDFAKALKKVKKTGESAANFQQKSSKKSASNMEDVTRGIQLLQRLMGMAGTNDAGGGGDDEVFYDGNEDEMKVPEME